MMVEVCLSNFDISNSQDLVEAIMTEGNQVSLLRLEDIRYN